MLKKLNNFIGGINSSYTIYKKSPNLDWGGNKNLIIFRDFYLFINKIFKIYFRLRELLVSIPFLKNGQFHWGD